jgi:hypothetical protein
MFVSPKFLTCKVKVLGHEGRDFMNRISALIKDTQGSSPSIAKKKKKKRERERAKDVCVCFPLYEDTMRRYNL